MSGHDPQLLKGSLTLLILKLLADEESYGYEVVSRLQAAGLTDVFEGSVYPALSRLERDGLLSSRLVSSTSGPARKYYKPSKSGQQQLEELTTAWRELTDIMKLVLDK